jgi:phosphatidylglycerophosphatase A
MKICDRIPAIKACSFTDRLHAFAATGGGMGFCPLAPGTTGSIGGLAVAWMISCMPSLSVAPILGVLTVLAVLAAEKTATIVNQKDPGFIVIDEIAGICFALAWIPFSPFNILVQFLLFRLLDIFKPFPVGWMEKNLPGGWGIVMDDVVAGIIANLIWRAGTLVYQTW